MKKRAFGGKGGKKNGARNGKSRSFGTKFVKKSSSGGWKQETARPIRTATPPAFVKKTAAAKLVQALQDKKTRAERKLFLVEGEISVMEALASGFVPETLFVTHGFLDEYPEILERCKPAIQIVDEQELSGLGTLAVNKSVIGAFKQKILPPLVIASEVVLALADVSDPGNLGTIIRIADWYGIKKIICSGGTVDVYNPKVISASKGSFARVHMYYENLETFFAKNETVPVFAADMQGDDVHTIDFPTRGILLLGNESHGIPENLSELITKYVTIPRFGNAESLNVAIAGAVILDNWLR